VTTEGSRRHHIQTALAAYNEQDAASRETYKVPFKGGITLPVIELKIEVPVLNDKSFRIAPLLADHPKADVVAADPDSAEAQAVVSELVRGAHRKVEDLKGSLSAGGQHHPGVITRSGKLINANTRCVLLRELWAAGDISSDRIRVAVLPQDFGPGDELQLESVLQQQREHKDEYNFVSELMMLRTLVDQAKLTPAQIAQQQDRGRNGEREVRTLLEVLNLMETACRLRDPENPIPISTFVTGVGQAENWKGVLANYKKVQSAQGQAAADDLLRAFLVNTYLGTSAVHKGARAIDENWIEDDFVAELRSRTDDVAKALVNHIEKVAAEPPPETEELEGGDLLDDDDDEPEAPGSLVGNATLGLVADVKAAGTGEIALADGTAVEAADAFTTLVESASEAIASSQRGNRAERPVKAIEAAIKNLQRAHEALAEVVHDDEFEVYRTDAVDAVDQVRTLADQIDKLLDGQ
jgi:hypothetical protein